MVVTPNGDFKKINEIEVGDIVQGWMVINNTGSVTY